MAGGACWRWWRPYRVWRWFGAWEPDWRWVLASRWLSLLLRPRALAPPPRRGLAAGAVALALEVRWLLGRPD